MNEGLELPQNNIEDDLPENPNTESDLPNVDDVLAKTPQQIDALRKAIEEAREDN